MVHGTVPSDGIIRLRLPYPPSVNHLYANVQGGRVLSKAGRAFHHAVAEQVWLQLRQWTCLTGRLAMAIMAHGPDARTRDLSNLLKVTEDALVEAGVLADDEQIDHLTITRGTMDRPLGHLRVTIEEIR